MRQFLLAGAALLGLTAAASAAPITPGSILSLDGNDTFTANSVTFIGNGNIGFGTGSFAGMSCVGCMTMTSFTSGTSTPFTLYSGNGTSLSASSDAFSFSSGVLDNLTVVGAGTLTLTGFDPTPGNYILTTQGPSGAEVTFSVTTVGSGAPAVVPEPASLVILGTGLLGLGVVVRRKRQHCPRPRAGDVALP